MDENMLKAVETICFTAVVITLMIAFIRNM